MLRIKLEWQPAHAPGDMLFKVTTSLPRISHHFQILVSQETILFLHLVHSPRHKSDARSLLVEEGTYLLSREVPPLITAVTGPRVATARCVFLRLRVRLGLVVQTCKLRIGRGGIKSNYVGMVRLSLVRRCVYCVARVGYKN